MRVSPGTAIAARRSDVAWTHAAPQQLQQSRRRVAPRSTGAGSPALGAVCAARPDTPARSHGAVVTPRSEEDPFPLTRRILASLPASSGDASGGAGGSAGAGTWDALQRADAAWTALRTGAATRAAVQAPPFAVRHPGKRLAAPAAFDVVVCGGTLGVFYAAALAARGVRVCVLERGPLVGRSQDWNISRTELNALVAAGAVTQGDVDAAITAEFNPCRCAFHGASEADSVLVTDVLNLGVSPAALVAAARRVVETSPQGCVVLERAPVTSVDVLDDGAAVQGCSLPDGSPVTGRLVVDCMGHASPLVRQVRAGARPDGVCLVVGTCARGFPVNDTSDVICTASHMEAMGPLRQQFFWEAFPAFGSGPSDRTTYMFTYLDADPERPSLTQMLERYWSLLEKYQHVKLSDLQVTRVLFGCFPTYRDSPLRMRGDLDRLLAVGDASGIQSPLSFGGLAALCRHLGRVTDGLAHALEVDALDASALGLLNPYLPNLSGAWLFQRAMSAPRGCGSGDDFVNTLLATNFGVMRRLGTDTVLRPFLQDVPQLGPLTATLAGMMATRPWLIPRILAHVGPAALLDWVGHYTMLIVYTVLWAVVGKPLRNVLGHSRAGNGAMPWWLSRRAAYVLARWVDAWEFGSGADYTH